MSTEVAKRSSFLPRFSAPPHGGCGMEHRARKPQPPRPDVKEDRTQYADRVLAFFPRLRTHAAPAGKRGTGVMEPVPFWCG